MGRNVRAPAKKIFNSLLKQLIERRVELGLSQEEVSERAGLSLHAVDRLENGVGMSWMSVEAVANVLGLKLSVVKDGDVGYEAQGDDSRHHGQYDA